MGDAVMAATLTFVAGLSPANIIGYRRNGHPIYLMQGGAPDGDGQPAPNAGGADGGQPANGAAPTDNGGSGTGYPANTPVGEMNDKQQAAYWKAQNRKQEDRNKQIGLTPEQAQELRDKAKRADDYDGANATEIEKREKAAREAVTADLTTKFGARAVEDAFRLLIGDRVTADETDDFIDDLNLTRFLNKDGRVDTARVIARVNKFAPATGSTTSTKGPTVTGHGSTSGTRNPSATGINPGDAGRAALARRFPQK